MNNPYEKAIGAYQFQVNRYHTWMNYYSLFHGALLVALYTVGCSCNVEDKSLFSLITVVGYWAGLCWLGTVIGNRKWIEHWIEIVKQTEDQLEEKSAVYMVQPQNKYGLLSTQKIMQLFTMGVTFAWGFMACKDGNRVSIAIIAVMTLFALIAYFTKCKWIYSSISSNRTNTNNLNN